MATREEVDALIADSKARQKSRLTARALSIGAQNAPDVSLEMRGTGTTAPTPSVVDSAEQGFHHGFTFGGNDELAGVIGRGMQMVGNATSGVDPSFQEADGYKVARDEERAKDEAAKAAHPVANFAGNVGGGILGVAGGVGAASRLAPALAAKAPALAAPLAKAGNYLADMPALQKLLAAGGVQGAAQGVGEADTVGDIPKDAAIGAGSGALLSLLGAGAGKAVGSVATGLAEKYTPELAAKLRVLTAVGSGKSTAGAPALLKAVNNVEDGAEGLASTMNSANMGGIDTTAGLLERAKEANDLSQRGISSVLDSVEAMGGRVPVREITDRLRTTARDLYRSTFTEPTAFHMADLADRIDAKYGESIPIRLAQKLKTDAANRLNWIKAGDSVPLPDAQAARLEAVRALGDAMDNTVARTFATPPPVAGPGVFVHWQPGPSAAAAPRALPDGLVFKVPEAPADTFAKSLGGNGRMLPGAQPAPRALPEHIGEGDFQSLMWPEKAPPAAMQVAAPRLPGQPPPLPVKAAPRLSARDELMRLDQQPYRVVVPDAPDIGPPSTADLAQFEKVVLAGQSRESMSPLELYQRARKVWQASHIVSEAAQGNLDRGLANRSMGLGDWLAGLTGVGVGMASGHPLAAAAAGTAAVTAKKAASAYGSSLNATATEQASKVIDALRSSPRLAAAIPEASDALMRAAQLGGPMLLLEYLHQRQNPEVARALDEATATQAPQMRAPAR